MSWWQYILSAYGFSALCIAGRVTILAQRHGWFGYRRIRMLGMILLDSVLWLPGIVIEGGTALWGRLK